MESDIDSLIFEDGEFQAGIARFARPLLSSREKTGYTPTGLYWSLYQAERPRALMTVCHGFSEGMYKYREFIYCMLKENISCLIYEQRGHGRSVRADGVARDAVHIDSFDTYVNDLAEITETLAVPAAQGLPLLLFGHSMGGCIAALFAARHPGLYSALVLSSPMLSVRIAKKAQFIAGPVLRLACRLGKGKQTVRVFTEEEKFRTSPTSSRERWQYCHDVRKENVLLQTVNPTVSWVSAALEASRKARKARIDVPVLLLMSEHDSLVDNADLMAYARANDNVKAVMIPSSRHEIILSPKAVLVQYYTAVLSFIGER